PGVRPRRSRTLRGMTTWYLGEMVTTSMGLLDRSVSCTTKTRSIDVPAPVAGPSNARVQLRAHPIMRRDSGAHQSSPVGCSALLACHSSRPARRVTANMEHGEHPDRTLSLIVKHAVREASE